jgi:hypothetical protein
VNWRFTSLLQKKLPNQISGNLYQTVRHRITLWFSEASTINGTLLELLFRIMAAGFLVHFNTLQCQQFVLQETATVFLQ